MATGNGVIGYESLTVSNAAVGCTTPQSGMTPMAALLTVETNSIRYRTDGTAPTTSEGHLVAAGGVIELYGRGEVKNFKAIRTASPDAVVKATYYSSYTP